MEESDYCPDDGNDPDHCTMCNGWGHRCPVFREAHPDRVAGAQAGFSSGYDPTRFYSSTFAAAHGEAVTAKKRKGH